MIQQFKFLKRTCTLYFFTHLDHSKGFGGKYGVQADRVDKSAVGWDYHEKSEKHASQKGIDVIYLIFI